MSGAYWYCQLVQEVRMAAGPDHRSNTMTDDDDPVPALGQKRSTMSQLLNSNGF